MRRDMGDKKIWAVALIVVGVIANNVVYLQDLWFGQPGITLDSWRAYLGIIVSVALVVVGLTLVMRASGAGQSE